MGNVSLNFLFKKARVQTLSVYIMNQSVKVQDAKSRIDYSSSVI